MKFILATIPIRRGPDNFPLVGATALLEVLIREGYEPLLYNIDGMRYGFDQVVDFFRKEQPDIVGISAVVSTAYRYTKELSAAIKAVSPATRIILGGCLAASAEILLRKCPIDICVIGEGEKVLADLARYWEKFHDFAPRQELGSIKGITYLDPKGDFIFTGYPEQLSPEELPQPNYGLLEKYSDINVYIREPLSLENFMHDERSYQPRRKGQKCCYVMTGKGCVCRCTFCHRWLQGYRAYPVDNIIGTIKRLKERYNAGFFLLGDECFGADAGMLERFIEAVAPLDILFSVGGIRIPVVYRNPGIVKRLKQAGCVEMFFGMESGSDKILAIMEKGATSRQNLEVGKLLAKEGMYTTQQLVIGMPGENERTIRETIETLKLILEDAPDYPVVSINYFQSLPGTPAYEFMRSKGLLGRTLDDEERYLLKISNINAGDSAHYINVTEECISKVLLWQHRIRVEVTSHWYKLRNWKPFKRPAYLRQKQVPESAAKRIWHSLNSTRFYFRMVSLLGGPFWRMMLFLLRLRLYGIAKAFLFTLGLKREEDRSAFMIKEARSLRQMPIYPDAGKLSVSVANMLILRKAR